MSTLLGGKILVVDDKENILGLWRRILEPDHSVVTAADGKAALGLLASGGFDVVVTDLKMPGADGLEVLAAVGRDCPQTETLLMTAFGTVENAVEAMRLGAFDFITKPFDPDQARLRVERALERRRLKHKAQELERDYLAVAGFGDLVGQSPAARRMFGLLEKAARTELTVLLLGESGTGKEVAARALHGQGSRKDQRFVAVNCGAIPTELMESELFGHVRGAFSGATADRAGLFESAHGGTLFLDEVSELPLALQVKLNRALQEREIRRVGESADRKVDVRVIAATNLELRDQIQAGRFREDLYYRLNVFPIRLPPLRDRREDIPPLTLALLQRQKERTGRGPARVSAESMRALLKHSWPGNIRELDNVLQRAAALAEGEQVQPEDLPELEAPHASSPASGDLLRFSFREALKHAQDQAARQYLAALMGAYQGSVTRAAEAAGMARETLHRQLRRCGLDPDEFRKANNPGESTGA